MADFVATLRVKFKAEDEVEANVISDQMADNILEDLDEEDGDEVLITQVTNTIVGITAEELLVNFRATRNALIRTRYQPCVDAAKGVDVIIQALERGDIHLVAPYDHGKFMDHVEAVLKGGNPQ